MSTMIRTVAPSAEPVTLDEFKAHARITLPFEDALLETYITEGREHVEDNWGVALVNQTWQLGVDQVPCATRQNPFASLPLPRWPLQAVSSVKYIATANSTYVVWASSNYQVDTGSRPGRITPLDNGQWPTVINRPNAILVEYTAGFGGSTASTTQSIAAVPQKAKSAISLYAAWRVRSRDVDEPVPKAVNALMDSVAGGSYRPWTPDEYL